MRGMGFLRRVSGRLSALLGEPGGRAPEGGDGPRPRTCQVLFVNGCDLPTLRRYRVTHQREQLELWGVTTDEVHYCSVCDADAERADVFVVYRCPLTDAVESFLSRVHALGKRAYFDVDDLVTSTSYTDDLPVVRAMSPADREVFEDGVRRTGRTLALCDGAVVTTERLAAELGKVVPEVLVNRNVASREMAELSRRARESVRRDPARVVIGYFSGSMTHNADFQQALPSVVEVLSARPNVYLELVGDLELPPELRPFSERVVFAEKVSWQELPALVASADINLAPLEPTLFNEAKSENKWTEAALVGVPTVASDFGAFARVVEHGVTGMLCSTRRDWTEALLSLVDDRALREAMGRRALARCLERHVTSRTGFPLARFLCGLPADIDHLVPADEGLRREWVDGHLVARGLRRGSLSFDPEPWASVSLDERLGRLRAARAEGRRALVCVYERACGDTATFRYFGYNVAQRLESSGSWFSTYLFVDELGSAQELLDMAAALMLVRCRVRPELVSLATWAKGAGVRVAYLIDDDALGADRAPHIIDLMAADPTSEFERAFWTGTTERFRLASELADCLVVPNGYFARLLSRRQGRPVLVVHSSVNDEQVAVANAICSSRGPATDARFVVGYFSGTSSHQGDFALVRDALVSFLQRHDDAALLLGGSLTLDEGLLELAGRGRVTVMPRVDYVTLQYLQASVDVVLAPLVADEFANCKSGLKVFEAGIVGTPACASPAFSYVEAIEQGETGFVCDGARDWEQALETLYEHPAARGRMGLAARERALARYYGDAVTDEIASACDAIASAASLPVPDEVAAVVAGAAVSNWDDPFEASPAFAPRPDAG